MLILVAEPKLQARSIEENPISLTTAGIVLYLQMVDGLVA